ncbi:MAG: HD domain-containing protein [Candidatus Asgardarchaeia archaeon]
MSIDQNLSTSILNKLEKYPKTRKLFLFLEHDLDVQGFLVAANSMVVGRLGYNDHGHVHSLITVSNAIDIFNILKKHVKPNIVAEHIGSYDDSLLVVVGATYLHDIGNMIHRNKHEMWSAILAYPILRKYVGKLYKDSYKRAHIISNLLHGIYSHDESLNSLTIEAGIVKVADGTDIAEGRSRIPYSMGKVDIHSVSALAIKNVRIEEGKEKPVKIIVEMENPAGIFQVEEILGKKLKTSGLEQYVDIDVFIKGEEITLSMTG